MNRVRTEQSYRILLGVNDRRRLHEAAKRRRISAPQLLQLILMTVLREDLIDAVLDDDPVAMALKLDEQPGPVV